MQLPSASASGEELNELVGRHVKELIEINATEAELPECSPLGLARNIGLNVRLQQWSSKER